MKILELVMIVKNSGEVLRECLNKNKNYIDHWTIVDTGSSDDTMKIVQEELKNIPGNLYQIDFIDFSQARNKSLELSSGSCKYTLILDDSYILHGGNKLIDILKKSDYPCYSIKIGNYYNEYLHNSYFSKRIIKSESNLKYQYRVHEDIIFDKPKFLESDIFLDDLETQEHKVRSVSRYKNDINLLLLDHEDFPNEPRIIYYIAKTYFNMEKYNDSLKYYKKLENVKNIDKEYLYTALYDKACINYMLNENITEFKNSLLYIHNNLKNNKIEASYKLAIIYRNENNFQKADQILSQIIKIPKNLYLKTISEPDIQEYYIPYLYIDVKLQLGQLNSAIQVLKNLLQIYPNNQPLLNIKYYLSGSQNLSNIRLSNNKTIVIHTGGGKNSIIQHWNPKGDKKMSGSEYMAINIAKEFIKLGYRLIIFGSFEDKKNNIDYQCHYENIEFIDYKYFSEFALKYVVDILIVSRYAAYLVYYENIKAVYLWVHDVLPILEDNFSKCIQFHKDKFKGVIAISEWQKNNISLKLNIPKDVIFLSRNAIYMERFNKTVDKIPFRFIYSSSAIRGLKYLIEIIPKIKEKYPETSLCIFTDQKYIDKDTLDNIKKLNYVFLNDKINQAQLSNEFLKSDIWLYPTNFEETYCITALEAMASKCLIATVDFCGLGEIAKGKGILVNSPIEDNISDLLEKLFFVLDRPKLKYHFIEKAYGWAKEQTYEKLAFEWKNNIFKNL
jgi:tetratricopeptide (TPR) repeat protein